MDRLNPPCFNKNKKHRPVRAGQKSGMTSRKGPKAQDPKKTNRASGEKKGKTTSNSAKGKTKRPQRKPREKLGEGELLKSEKFVWKVASLLGSGGFGDVYKVQKDDDSQEYAMKTEVLTGNARMLRLKIEVDVLLRCEKGDKKHFVKMIDRGKTDKFKFIVMTLVGASLEDFRKKSNIEYTPSTVFQIALQSLESLQDFHETGYIHRDIKPHNFAHGVGKNASIVYILDFGIARRIYEKDGVTYRKPRPSVKFLGTLRFASRSCHNKVEQGRKDDIETWLYMVCDLAEKRKGLSWRRETVQNEIVRKKTEFFNKDWFVKYFEENCPFIVDLFSIAEELDKMKLCDEPKYEEMKTILLNTAAKRNIDLELPLDWTKVEDEKLQVEETQMDDPKDKSQGDKLEGSLDEEEDRGGSIKVPKQVK